MLQFMPPDVRDLTFAREDVHAGIPILRVERTGRCSPPMLDESGEAFGCLIPFGQLATLYFRREEPDHFYVAQPDWRLPEEDVEASIRAAADALRRGLN